MSRSLYHDKHHEHLYVLATIMGRFSPANVSGPRSLNALTARVHRLDALFELIEDDSALV